MNREDIEKLKKKEAAAAPPPIVYKMAPAATRVAFITGQTLKKMKKPLSAPPIQGTVRNPYLRTKEPSPTTQEKPPSKTTPINDSDPVPEQEEHSISDAECSSANQIDSSVQSDEQSKLSSVEDHVWVQRMANRLDA